jgi:peroxiredoxin
MMNRLVIFVSIFVLIVFSQFCLSQDARADEELWKHMGFQRIGPAEPPAFTLEDASGGMVSLEDLRGQVVLLNFWAIECKPCLEEMPYLEKLHKKLGDKGLAVVCIDDYDSMKEIRKFLKKHPYTFKILVDESGTITQKYKTYLLPTTFIIDKDGMAIGKAIGMRKWDSDESVKLFEELIKE